MIGVRIRHWKRVDDINHHEVLDTPADPIINAEAAKRHEVEYHTVDYPGKKRGSIELKFPSLFMAEIVARALILAYSQGRRDKVSEFRRALEFDPS